MSAHRLSLEEAILTASTISVARQQFKKITSDKNVAYVLRAIPEISALNEDIASTTDNKYADVTAYALSQSRDLLKAIIDRPGVAETVLALADLSARIEKQQELLMLRCPHPQNRVAPYFPSSTLGLCGVCKATMEQQGFGWLCTGEGLA